MEILRQTTKRHSKNGQTEPGVVVLIFNPNTQDRNVTPAWATIRSCLKMELVSWRDGSGGAALLPWLMTRDARVQSPGPVRWEVVFWHMSPPLHDVMEGRSIQHNL